MHVSSNPRRGRAAAVPFLFPLALGLAVTLGAPPAQAAPTLGFADAVARAGRAAPTVEARSAELTAARETAAQADRLPDPQLIVGLENVPIGSGPPDFGGSEMTMKKIGLMQQFPARARLRARRGVAESLIGRARALSTIELLEVREQVARSWLSAWASQHEVSTLEALRGQAALAVEFAEARLKGGTGSAVDAMAAKAAALEIENRIDTAETAVAQARAGLARWLGTESDVTLELDAAPDLASLPVSEAVLLATADEQRRLVDWRSREAVAEARLQEAIADKRPDWSVMAAYGQRGDGLDDMLMVEFRLDLPLFTANRQDRLIAARRAELQAAAAERRDAERAQLEAVRRALADWRGLRGQIDRHETQILPLADDRAEAALAAYGAGGPIQPWLEARRDELEAHLMHVRHLGELAQVWAALAYLLPEETAR
jgi:cobalt-zinc-cadmium efflux system outer membrane protein